jgi:20S proteasome subunit alpha 7
MAGTGSGYDLSVTTYTPDGRVYQVEYAQKAVESSGTALAICFKDGVVFATEKLLKSKMLVPGTNKRTYPLSRHAGMVIAGMVPDGRQIVNRGRSEIENYKNAYAEYMPADQLADRLGLYVHAHTLYWSYRPFGCSVLMGAVDPETKKPSLHCVDPSGLVFKYKGTAVGKGKQSAKTEIEKLLGAEGASELTCKAALAKVAKILHKVHDEKDSNFELEAAWICADSDYKFAAVPAALLSEAEDTAKKELEKEEDGDE